MRIGVFLFGGVEMADAGPGGTEPTERRYDQAAIEHAHRELLACGELAERLGYDSYWLTEHHFQHEGYEVVPNGLLFGAFLAARTSRIRIGTMFNVVGQWHPLRLAEDFALLHNLSGGRGILGVGRGTVPREILPLTAGAVSVGSYDNPAAAAADALNREITEESLDVLHTALTNERFRYTGTHFRLPPPGIPDRGGEVEELTLVPRPRYPYDTWQAVTSPPTLRAVPTRGLGGVFWLKERRRLAADWHAFADTYEQVHGRALARGERRMLVLNVAVADTRAEAMATVRAGHDEFWRFLAPYGWGRGYLGPDGRPADGDFVPTLEDSMAQGPWAVGTPADVAAHIAELDELLGLGDLVIFPAMPGDPYARAQEQLRRFARDVIPLLPAGVGADVMTAPAGSGPR
ncbi:LLM class flavin-dependent oxidoreductase [Frankia sp. AgB32]|uniref:LLM class flavin-dependent oxidoreductase n=1 Tax=Frankia sp. AgB32 TaxID=631119 RepID=UPI00200D7CE1|nr:LLM class flavin-dependent oxidoreductase [Frankia sp. AgB32]MCK9893559.1 LLM class flavin-dependent oxidoreductase [Frankia sp. AgB32]